MTFDGVSFIIVEEIALFADQEGAYTYAGLNAEDATEEAPTATTDGCGSVVGFGVMALLGAAFVALKKDRD